MHKLNPMVLEPSDCNGRFPLQLVAILLISHTIADKPHLFNPIGIEVEVLVEAQVGHCPFRSATALIFLAHFQERNLGLLVVALTLLQKRQRCHASSKASADDYQVVIRAGSHDVEMCSTGSNAWVFAGRQIQNGWWDVECDQTLDPIRAFIWDISVPVAPHIRYGSPRLSDKLW